MAETPTGSSFQENPTKSDSGGAKSRIPISESDSLQTRFIEVLNGESVSSFSRRCGVGESTLRNILNGALPRTDYLIAIANAGAVTVDWLATGRLPKTRAELRTTSSQSQSQTEGLTDDDNEMLHAVIRVAEHALRRADVSIEVAQRVEEAATAMAAKAQRWPELAARLEAARAAAALFRTTQQATTRD